MTSSCVDELATALAAHLQELVETKFTPTVQAHAMTGADPAPFLHAGAAALRAAADGMDEAAGVLTTPTPNRAQRRRARKSQKRR